MKNIRRLLFFLSSLIGLWVLVSFGGAMFDAANANFWTTSLMWALLTLLLAMPALVVFNHASTQADRTAQARKKATEKKAQSTAEHPPAEKEPFVAETERNRTLWPESEGQNWPPQQSKPRR